MSLHKLLGAVALCLTLASAHAQTISIASARLAATGNVVTVAGRVENGPELGSIRYIYDGTAALGVYFSATQLSQQPISPGDSIQVTGTVAPYNNLFELTPITSTQVVATGLFVAPVEFVQGTYNAAYAEQYEGRLVKLLGVASINTTGGSPVATFSGNTNYKVNNQTALPARVNAASAAPAVPNGIVGKPGPSSQFDLLGIMSQFSSTSATSGYQLLPRTYDDFILGSAPSFISPILPTDIGDSTLNLNVSTNNAGSTEVAYGLDTSVSFNSFLDTNKTVDHDFQLTGLLPGRIYYVRVTSRNQYGVNVTRVTPFVTASHSTGRMTAYFTRSVDTSVAIRGNFAKQLPNLSDDTLIAYINRAQATLDIAIYNFNDASLNSISGAINAAAARGVVCRLIYDGSQANASIGSLNPAVHKLASAQGQIPGTTGTTNRFSIMHNKFVIVDCDHADPNVPIVWTGSTNWTGAQMTTDYNNILIVQDQGLARVYKLEFEEMWGGSSATPGTYFNGTTGTARFGPLKTDNTPHTLKIAGRPAEVFFSPSDGTTAAIIRNINAANSSFQVAAYTITRTDIAYAVRDRARALPSGCSRGLTDDTAANSGTGTTFNIMLSGLGAGNMRIYNLPGIYHHKYVIVNQDDSAGARLLTGSHNWSNNGESKNDENTIVVYNQRIANQFYQEFAQRFKEIRGFVCGQTEVAPLAATSLLATYPNPTDGYLTLELPATMIGAKVEVHSLTGQLVATAVLTRAKGQINVANLPAGSYTVTATAAGKAVRAMVVKQ